MKDRTLGVTFLAIALLLGCVVVVSLLSDVIEWLQVGRWESRSLLRAGYDAHLIRARWFLATDWGWRVHEILDQIPLLACAVVMAGSCWGAGLWFLRR